MKAVLQVVGFTGAIGLILILSPLLALWGLNTVSEQAAFGWHIPHNLWTYLAVYALAVPFGRSTN